MWIDDTSYSRVIAWLKIALPILALGVLSTLFLVARTVDPAQQLPFAEVDVAEIAREQRIGAPNYSGVTREGAAIAVSARSASPDPSDAGRLTGDTVRAAIDLPSGERIDIKADQMELDYAAGIVELSRSIEITTQSGFALRTGLLRVSLDRTRVIGPSPVVLTGALGELSANRFELLGQPDPSDELVMVFNGDVKLLYDPQR